MQNRSLVPPPARLPVAPWYQRWTFAALGLLAPSVAVAWAHRRFCTPPRPLAIPAEEAAVLERAREATVESHGVRLATWTWGRGPAVLLVHGWGGRGGQLHRFVPPLLDRGYSVVTFDGPAHGASGGSLSSLVEQGRAVRAVADSLSEPLHAIIAHSMGGAATGLALDEGLRARAAACVAVPFAAEHWLLQFADALALTGALREGLVRSIEARVGRRFADLTMANVAPRMTTPLLVVHDTADKEVPYSSGAAVAAHWPGARLVTTSGLGHKRILADAGVIDAVVDFVASA